jgi:hypothetical protein
MYESRNLIKWLYFQTRILEQGVRFSVYDQYAADLYNIQTPKKDTFTGHTKKYFHRRTKNMYLKLCDITFSWPLLATGMKYYALCHRM